MNWCRYRVGEKVVDGIIEDDIVWEATESPFEGGVATGERQLLSHVSLCLPCIPANFYAAGANYRGHLAWAADNLGGNGKEPSRADIGYRANNSLVAQGEHITIPRDSSGLVQAEGELVAVIGKTVKHLTRRNALDFVLGYTIGNDVSERTWQSSDRTLWRAKNTDTFNPMGPWITPGLDPEALEVTTRINGVEVSHYHTKDMIFSLIDFLVETTKYVTLYAGDVMWMGCDGATPVIKSGDVVEIEIPEIGVLRNPVVGE